MSVARHLAPVSDLDLQVAILVLVQPVPDCPDAFLSADDQQRDRLAAARSLVSLVHRDDLRDSLSDRVDAAVRVHCDRF